jgi:hypothetical protein
MHPHLVPDLSVGNWVSPSTCSVRSLYSCVLGSHVEIMDMGSGTIPRVGTETRRIRGALPGSGWVSRGARRATRAKARGKNVCAPEEVKAGVCVSVGLAEPEDVSVVGGIPPGSGSQWLD